MPECIIRMEEYESSVFVNKRIFLLLFCSKEKRMYKLGLYHVIGSYLVGFNHLNNQMENGNSLVGDVFVFYVQKYIFFVIVWVPSTFWTELLKLAVKVLWTLRSIVSESSHLKYVRKWGSLNEQCFQRTFMGKKVKNFREQNCNMTECKCKRESTVHVSAKEKCNKNLIISTSPHLKLYYCPRPWCKNRSGKKSMKFVETLSPKRMIILFLIFILCSYCMYIFAHVYCKPR